MVDHVCRLPWLLETLACKEESVMADGLTMTGPERTIQSQKLPYALEMYPYRSRPCGCMAYLIQFLRRRIGCSAMECIRRGEESKGSEGSCQST